LKELDVLMDPANPRKIQAIKALRLETQCGLKEAKLAVERRHPGHSTNQNPEAYAIKPFVAIKAVIVDFGDGEVQLDLNDLHMLTLVNMNKIGIEELQRIIGLHDLLKGWEDPHENE